jgi:hypothetical protein
MANKRSNKQANKQQSNRGNRQPRVRRARNPQPQQRRQVEPVPRNLLALLDPFGPRAPNAKYPSVGSTNTITEGYRAIINITSDANGLAYFAFNPMGIIATSFYQTGSYAAGNWTPAAATYPAAGQTMFSTVWTATDGSAKMRVNSFGVRAISSASMTNASGTIQIGMTSAAVEIGVPMPAFAGRVFTHYEVHPMSHGAEYSIVSHPTGELAHELQELDTVGVTSYGWENIVLQFTALPASTTVGIIEVYCNMEYTVGNHALARLATPSAVANFHHQSALDDIRSNAARVAKGGIVKVAEHYEKKLVNYAKSKASSAASHPGRTMRQIADAAVEVD